MNLTEKVGQFLHNSKVGRQPTRFEGKEFVTLFRFQDNDAEKVITQNSSWRT
jgi:hypothetical protein